MDIYSIVQNKLEMHQDLNEYNLEKMKRVQRKVENLRKAAAPAFIDENKFDKNETSFFERIKL